MKLKQTAFIIIPFALVLGFQNCQKPAGVQQSHLSDDSSAVPYEVIPLKNENLQKIELRTDLSQVVNQLNKSVTVEVQNLLQIDLLSGEILAKNEINTQIQKYCLDSSSKNELIEILKQDSVCKFRKELPPESVCSLPTILPYATIITNSAQINLVNSYKHSCNEAQQVELCNNSDSLKSWVKDLKKRLPSLSCQ